MQILLVKTLKNIEGAQLCSAYRRSYRLVTLTVIILNVQFRSAFSHFKDTMKKRTHTKALFCLISQRSFSRKLCGEKFKTKLWRYYIRQTCSCPFKQLSSPGWLFTERDARDENLLKKSRPCQVLIIKSAPVSPTRRLLLQCCCRAGHLRYFFIFQ